MTSAPWEMIRTQFRAWKYEDGEAKTIFQKAEEKHFPVHSMMPELSWHLNQNKVITEKKSAEEL